MIPPQAPWLNWIEQPPPKGQVAGSNPAGVTSLVFRLPPTSAEQTRRGKPAQNHKWYTKF